MTYGYNEIPLGKIKVEEISIWDGASTNNDKPSKTYYDALFKTSDHEEKPPMKQKQQVKLGKTQVTNHPSKK